MRKVINSGEFCLLARTERFTVLHFCSVFGSLFQLGQYLYLF